MNSETKIMTSVATVINFIKERVRADLATATKTGMITLTDNDLKKTCNIIESSIESSFNKSMHEVIHATKSLKG